MAEADYTKNDYQFWPGTDTVTVTDPSGPTSDTGLTAAEMDLSRARSIFGGVFLNGDEKTWIVPNTQLSNLSEIRDGCTVTDSSGGVWTVKGVQRVRAGTQWILLCVKEQ